MTETATVTQDLGTPVVLEGSDEMEVMFEPLEVLGKLREMAANVPTIELRGRLALKDIHEYPAVFQPRGISEQHIQELVRAIKSRGEVDPILVVQIGREAVVVDGHHRRAAYAFAGRHEDVPVTYFEGTLEEAVLAAGEANSKAKLPMDNQTRQNYAWRLVLMDYTKKEVMRAAAVSEGQVANMRRVRRSLGNAAFDHDHWWQAHGAAKGQKAFSETDDEREARLEAQAANYADRLRKEFSTKLANNTDLAARALALYFGRRLGDLVIDLRGHLSEFDGDDEDEENFDF